MTKTKTKKNMSKTIRNLISEKSQRQPRLNLRGSLNATSTLLSGNEYNEALTVAAADTKGTKVVYLAPGNNSGRANAAVQGVGRLFQQGIFLPGTKLTYVPAVGINTPGNVYITFLDNPTLIVKYFGLATDADRLNFIWDTGNVLTAPVWQEISYNLTRPPRRKYFSTDASITSNTDEIDQGIQGVFLVAVSGTENTGSTARTMGQLVVHCKMRFDEIKSFAS